MHRGLVCKVTRPVQLSGVLILLIAFPLSSLRAQTSQPNLTDPIEILAQQLASAKTDEERAALLNAKRELGTIALRKTLIQKGNGSSRRGNTRERLLSIKLPKL